MTELERLESLIACCDRCSLVQTVSHKVFGEGDPHAKVMIVGDTPGREENSSGLPFVGDSESYSTKPWPSLGLRDRVSTWLLRFDAGRQETGSLRQMRSRHAIRG